MAKSSRGGKIGASSTGASGGGKAEATQTVTPKGVTQEDAAKYKTVSQAVDFIKEQVGIDINAYRNSASQMFEKRGEITLDITDMGRNERNRLATALNQKYSPYTGEQSGTWLFTIKKKPKPKAQTSNTTKTKKADVSKMTKSQLEKAATGSSVISNYAKAMRITEAEAERRISMLLGAQTSAQLKKFVKKYQ